MLSKHHSSPLSRPVLAYMGVGVQISTMPFLLSSGEEGDFRSVGFGGGPLAIWIECLSICRPTGSHQFDNSVKETETEVDSRSCCRAVTCAWIRFEIDEMSAHCIDAAVPYPMETGSRLCQLVMDADLFARLEA